MKASYYTVDGEILGQEIGAGQRLDYLPDALGSVVTAVDQAKAVIHSARYKPYGADLSSSGSKPAFGWVGTLGYRETGLRGSEHYMRARHYGVSEGSWISVDPLWPVEQPYAYVAGNPSSFVDPYGLRPAMACVPGPCDGCEDAAKAGKLCQFIEARIPANEQDELEQTYTACCKGKTEVCYGRILQRRFRKLSKGDVDKIKRCVDEHEQVHKDGLKRGDNKCSGGDCGGVIPKNKGKGRNEECAGYTKGAKCMMREFPEGPCSRDPQICATFCSDCDNIADFCKGKPVPPEVVAMCKKVKRTCDSLFGRN